MTPLRIAALAVALVALIALVVVGLAEDDTEKAGDTAVNVYQAIGEDDADAFCEQLSSSVHEEFTKLKIGGYVELGKKPTCESNFELFRLFYGEPDKAKDASPVNISINGNRATAALVFLPDEDETEGTPTSERVKLSLIKEDGDWKLASLNIPSPPPVTTSSDTDTDADTEGQAR
jgi:hypothetical protein